ncbi:hypothetical protein EV182_008527, partial [Spiromyces aspiralis]
MSDYRKPSTLVPSLAMMVASAGAVSSSPNPSQAMSEKSSWSLFEFGRRKKPSTANEQDPEYEQAGQGQGAKKPSTIT